MLTFRSRRATTSEGILFIRLVACVTFINYGWLTWPRISSRSRPRRVPRRQVLVVFERLLHVQLDQRQRLVSVLLGSLQDHLVVDLHQKLETGSSASGSGSESSQHGDVRGAALIVDAARSACPRRIVAARPRAVPVSAQSVFTLPFSAAFCAASLPLPTPPACTTGPRFPTLVLTPKSFGQSVRRLTVRD